MPDHGSSGWPLFDDTPPVNHDRKWKNGDDDVQIQSQLQDDGLTAAADDCAGPENTVDSNADADASESDAPIETSPGDRRAIDESATDEQAGHRALAPTCTRLQRIRGCVLGAAIGDAMGHPTEFIGSFTSICKRYGKDGVVGFELYWERGGRRFAPYTDDTQMAECVLRALLDERTDLDRCMRGMAERFVEWSTHPQGGHRAPGNACMSGCRALAGGAHWSEAGGPAAGGCGSVMRAYPFGLVFADDVDRAEDWSVAHSKLTHRDPIALAASAAMAVGVVRVLRDESVERVTSEMTAAACRYSARTAAMMARAIQEAREGVGPDVTLDRLRAWAAHEAIAAAVYLFERHPNDPRAAILEGANTPGDSDSIATLAGALVGARCGVQSIPEDWVRDVERSEELDALAAQIEP